MSGTDDAPIKPLPIDQNNPTKDIYQNFKSFPGVDGVNLWPFLIEHPESANRSSAHAALVVTKEVASPATREPNRIDWDLLMFSR